MQIAANGAVVVVATALQPLIVAPDRVKVTAPATLVVAEIVWGRPSRTAEVLRVTVGVVWAADAAVTPTVATEAKARTATLTPLMKWVMGGIPSLGSSVTSGR